MPRDRAGMLRVCHIVTAYPEPDKGRFPGAFFRPLSFALRDEGIDASILAGSFHTDSPLRTMDGEVEVRRFSSGEEEGNRGPLGSSFVLRSLRYVVAGCRVLFAWSREHPFDVLHGHQVLPNGLMAVLAGWRLGLPVVITTHGSDLLLYPKKRPLSRFLLPWIFRRSGCVIAVAPHLAAEVNAYAAEVNTTVIPMGYDDRCFSPGVPAGERCAQVVSARMLAPLYRVDTLVQAAELLSTPEMEVAIYGDGPEREGLERLAKRDATVFHGAVDAPLLAAALQTAAIYVSTARTDGSSVSLLEAMACGAFPIVTDIPANRGWVTHGENGFLVPVGEPEALAAAVDEAWSNVELRQTAMHINCERMREARWPAIAQKVAAVYTPLLPAAAHG